MCSTGRTYDVILFVLLIFTCVQTKLVNAQSSCTTPWGHEGICVPINECAALVDCANSMNKTEDVNTWNIRVDFLRNSQCGVTGNQFLVCCPKEHKNLHLVTNQNCGNSEIPRIHLGKTAELFEFPWMALIAYRIGNKIEYHCGGSLINSRYVLTAGHCIEHRYTVVGVRLGEHNINLSPDCFEVDTKCPHVQDIRVEEIIVHEKYNVTVNDIGLIRLSKPADLSKINVIPICLPITPTLRLFSLINKKSTIAGWGTTEDVEFSDVLQKVQLSVIDNARCQELFSRPNFRSELISSAMKDKFCTYGSSGEDSCRGDSGGPLMYLTQYEKKVLYVLYGIVSYGSKECNGSAPSIYTSVGAYLEWILDRLRP